MHRVAPCCTVLHRVAPCCTVMHRVAPCCTVLHRVASCCTVLHRVAPCCPLVRCSAARHTARAAIVGRGRATCWTALQSAPCNEPPVPCNGRARGTHAHGHRHGAGRPRRPAAQPGGRGVHERAGPWQGRLHPHRQGAPSLQSVQHATRKMQRATCGGKPTRAGPCAARTGVSPAMSIP